MKRVLSIIITIMFFCGCSHSIKNNELPKIKNITWGIHSSELKHRPDDYYFPKEDNQIKSTSYFMDSVVIIYYNFTPEDRLYEINICRDSSFMSVEPTIYYNFVSKLKEKYGLPRGNDSLKIWDFRNGNIEASFSNAIISIKYKNSDILKSDLGADY